MSQVVNSEASRPPSFDGVTGSREVVTTGVHGTGSKYNDLSAVAFYDIRKC